jgi:hypothetical protein
MFWANKDGGHSRPIGADAAKTQEATMKVIDGQQRLTSLYMPCYARSGSGATTTAVSASLCS